MKAKIEIEINDDNISEHEAKLLLAEKLFNLCYEWITFETPPVIEFTSSKKKTKEKQFFNFKWDDTEN
jgi:hypothetical protein|tara:strand:+ start:408 stop:611 length:204 start_codon:yes stop_codon:yes gene_type:complete